MTDRTTAELIERLNEDVDRCHSALIAAIDSGEIDPDDGGVVANYEFEARQLIRSIIAYIEAVTFSVKVSSVAKCMQEGKEVSDHERFLAIEVNGDLNDKGEIVERSSKIRLAQNVRFAFRLHDKASGVPSQFDPSKEWWSCFRDTMRVRDRLVHPRLPEDIDVSGTDITNALKAKNGFDGVLSANDEDEA